MCLIFLLPSLHQSLWTLHYWDFCCCKFMQSCVGWLSSVNSESLPSSGRMQIYLLTFAIQMELYHQISASTSIIFFWIWSIDLPFIWPAWSFSVCLIPIFNRTLHSFHPVGEQSHCSVSRLSLLHKQVQLWTFLPHWNDIKKPGTSSCSLILTGLLCLQKFPSRASKWLSWIVQHCAIASLHLACFSCDPWPLCSVASVPPSQKPTTGLFISSFSDHKPWHFLLF